ncbi:MAG: AAA family ATPase, partial [Bacteroidales bacterium]|nr:AAA family ATPase [Bacteroidales bacterium]
HSAAIAVSNTPGQVYNPLFIYGPPGVGKTHLLYAIANGIRKGNPNANIVYIKGDQFTNEKQRPGISLIMMLSEQPEGMAGVMPRILSFCLASSSMVSPKTSW